MTVQPGSAAHWDGAYLHGDTTCSWFQDKPNQSLRTLDTAGVTRADSVIDVGGGASTLVEALLDLGGSDGVTVLDISRRRAAGGSAARGHARRASALAGHRPTRLETAPDVPRMA